MKFSLVKQEALMEAIGKFKTIIHYTYIERNIYFFNFQGYL